MFSILTTWVQHGNNMGTTWVQHGYNMGTTWVQHGHNMGTTWANHFSCRFCMNVLILHSLKISFDILNAQSMSSSTSSAAGGEAGLCESFFEFLGVFFGGFRRWLPLCTIRRRSLTYMHTASIVESFDCVGHQT